MSEGQLPYRTSTSASSSATALGGASNVVAGRESLAAGAGEDPDEGAGGGGPSATPTATGDGVGGTAAGLMVSAVGAAEGSGAGV